jgi:5-methylcytosine-specific restriction protein A
MSTLLDLKPKAKERVGDLLKRVGITVKNNRHFLSKCAFDQDGKVILNFWYGKQIVQQGEDIIIKWHIPPKEPSARMRTIHDAIKSAIQRNLPIHIIILDGDMAKKGSKVSRRSLDSAVWFAKLDSNTGDCVLTRGDHRFADQFSTQEEPNQKPERRAVSGQAFVRNPIVRAKVLLRANGKCEWCGESGFMMSDGKIYLETHHVIPLSEDGLDIEKNVAALCPNHHREAHHGAIKAEMRKKLLSRLAS